MVFVKVLGNLCSAMSRLPCYRPYYLMQMEAINATNDAPADLTVQSVRLRMAFYMIIRRHLTLFGALKEQNG
jgi:hypothetical protein